MEEIKGINVEIISKETQMSCWTR